jgi:hypothetical protein
MHPEWSTFQHSPHARLKCVDCHVGPEPESYVSVKLSGLRRLAAVATGSFERPIATPIRNMRPAREVCEQCHWSRRFIDYQEQTRAYFLSDEENTPLKVRMLMKIGGGENGFVGGVGIHYHMVVAARVEYMARGRQRQEIPWVRVTTKMGEVREYEDTDDPLSDSEKETLEVRTMDCLDCHNRPAHHFQAPVDAVNAALAAGVISRDLPFIKLEAVKALDAGYATQAAALAGISDRLGQFYSEEHAEVIEDKFADLEQAIATVQTIYLRTIFPEMKAQWSAYPDNIGHRDSPGCFRCHNDRMESAEGDAMVLECSTCHVILAQGADVQDVRTSFDRGEPFFHPGDDDYLEEYTECVDCHSGGADLYE